MSTNNGTETGATFDAMRPKDISTDNLPLDGAALSARVAELEQERDACGRLAAEQGVTANVLRRALEDVLLNRDCACYEDGEPNCCDVCAARYADAAKTIATTPRASLAAYRKSVLEQAAQVAFAVRAPKSIGRAHGQHHEAGAQSAAAAIRALAAQEDK